MNVNQTALRTALLSVIRNENVSFDIDSISPQQQSELLGDMLIASDKSWQEETLQLIDKVFESNEKESVNVNSLQVIARADFHNTRVSVWQGDITTLKIDAIVNAGNERGLGCFQPGHRCIDNVIHRQSGPRLRMACRKAMVERSTPLASGTEPIVTKGFHLPAKNVIHVTGPQVFRGQQVSDWHRRALTSAYGKSLDAAAALGLKSIAFPCISTGLFGFPAQEAVHIALSTIQAWLKNNKGVFDDIVFNVFIKKDAVLYQQTFGSYFGMSSEQSRTFENVVVAPGNELRLVKTWIKEADAVLICAGAGMSVKKGEMVYTSPDDFARAYPWFPKWGYRTSYEVMGLEGDPNVPRTAKWALYAKHMDNMRWAFKPNNGYDTLLELVKEKNYFVLTSNVDSCFTRSGFEKNCIYTPQGEWTYTQCKRGCERDSVYESRPILDRVLPTISGDGFIPEELIPKCPRCGGDMFGNVRSGRRFLHHHYEAQNDKLREWMESLIRSEAKVVVIEIGAGFNTPTVTRFPVESFAQELGSRGMLVRINPNIEEAMIPSNVRGVSIAKGWQVLHDIADAEEFHSSSQVVGATESGIRQEQLREGKVANDDLMARYKQYFGHFDWRRFLLQLKDQ